MASEWCDTTVGKFAPFLYGRGLPEVRRCPGSVPVYGSNGVVGFHSEPLLSGPAVIIGRKGSVGAVHYSPEPCWPIDTTFYVVDDNPARLRFKYYLLKALGLEHMNADSAVPGLNRDAAHERIIKVPPLPEQRAIAHILGTLDDKIELNRRMNETLEAIARAIFKSWFVDFDPAIDNAILAGNPIPSTLAEKAARRREMLARAKAEGRDSCFPKHIAHLFPARFIDSDLGPIPEGWEVVIFDEIVDAKQGKYLPETEIMEIQSGEYIYPVWGGKGIRGYARKKMYDEPVVVLTCRGSNCGLLNIADSKNWITNIAFACKPKIGSVYFIYTYFVHDSFVDFISGSAQPQITYEALRYKQMPYPISERAADLFSSLVLPLFKKISENNYQSRTLGSLRDALLPKLIRGEIRVKDAERFFKERGL